MKLSNILAILTLIQFLYMVVILGEYYIPKFKTTMEHEDLVFILHLMTWFIVRAIENNKIKG